MAELTTLPKVQAPDTIVNPVAAAEVDPAIASSVLGDTGQVGLIQVRQDINVEDLTIDDKEQFEDILSEFRTGGLDVRGTGSLMQVQELGGTAEMLGFVVAFVVMIVAFAALVAAFIPIITGILGVLISINLVTLGAGIFNMNESATGIITMLGIAVSIDYALFIVSRYRTELNLGGSREAAVGRAVVIAVLGPSRSSRLCSERSAGLRSRRGSRVDGTVTSPTVRCPTAGEPRSSSADTRCRRGGGARVPRDHRNSDDQAGTGAVVLLRLRGPGDAAAQTRIR